MSFFKRKKLCLYFLIAITCILVILSVVFANNMSSNVATMVAGLWSAYATAILGILAYWQNKKYQKIADQYNMFHDTPEIYIISPSTDFSGYAKPVFINKITGYGSHDGGLSTNVAFRFASLDKVILHLRPIKVIVQGKSETLTTESGKELSLFHPFDQFAVNIRNCQSLEDGKYSIELILEYYDIYEQKYNKSFICNITVQQNEIVSHTWGKLKKAERIYE